jgi:hypothetical protein
LAFDFLWIVNWWCRLPQHPLSRFWESKFHHVLQSQDVRIAAKNLADRAASNPPPHSMQILTNGLVFGSATADLALGFQAIYLPTRVFFIGLAGVYSFTPFIAYAVLKQGGPLWLAAAIIQYLLCEWSNHAPLVRRRASAGAYLIASLRPLHRVGPETQFLSKKTRQKLGQLEFSFPAPQRVGDK